MVGQLGRRRADDPGVAAVAVDDHHPPEPVLGDAGAEVGEQGEDRFRAERDRARERQPVRRESPRDRRENQGRAGPPRPARPLRDRRHRVGIGVDGQMRPVLLDGADRQQQRPDRAAPVSAIWSRRSLCHRISDGDATRMFCVDLVSVPDPSACQRPLCAHRPDYVLGRRKHRHRSARPYGRARSRRGRAALPV